MGPYSGVISQFIEQLKQRKPPVIFGDGTQTRDFVYVNDTADVALDALSCEGCVGNAFNIGSGKETSIKGLANILRLFGVKSVKPEYRAPRTGDIERSCADLSKAKRVLGYKPDFSLEKGLSELVIEQNKI
jgi:UDP-glucose 4-epimerase